VTQYDLLCKQIVNLKNLLRYCTNAKDKSLILEGLDASIKLRNLTAKNILKIKNAFSKN